MATYEEAVTALLNAHAGLSALVGARNYLEEAPQRAQLPYTMRIEVSSTEPTPLDGPASMITRRVQFIAWGRSPAEASAVRAEIRGALAGFRGVVEIPDTGSPGETFELYGCIPDTEYGVASEDQAGRDAASLKEYGRGIDFFISHSTQP